MTALPAWFARTLTWDRGIEIARHKHVTAATGIQVYFADPHAPWQRGSNENINGLLREYLPKGTDLRPHTAAQLQAIAAELNDRPRKRLGFRTPAEQFAKLLEQDNALRRPPESAPGNSASIRPGRRTTRRIAASWRGSDPPLAELAGRCR